MRDDRGSASVLCVAIVASLVCLSAGVMAVAGAGVVRQRVSGAADAAALAAADVATGAFPGLPCEEAARLARANGAMLQECLLKGTVATVTASAAYLGIAVVIEARAGPASERSQSKIASR